MPSRDQEVCDHTHQTVDEWLRLVGLDTDERPGIVTDWCFPTDRLADEYLATIHLRSENEVKGLMRKFLITSGTLGCDLRLREEWLQRPQVLDRVLDLEFGKRIFTGPAWEGMTWIIDLLPNYPEEALHSISAYYLAHMHFLPDGRAHGLSDVENMIRVRYLKQTHPREVLYGLTSPDFEYLVAAVFRKLGYLVAVTPRTRDGGCDVRARMLEGGRRESVLIECKLHKQKLAEKEVRSLAGLLSAEKANRGLIIAPGGFTKPAHAFAKRARRLELIDFDAFDVMLNRTKGANWHRQLQAIIAIEKTSEVSEAASATKRIP